MDLWRLYNMKVILTLSTLNYFDCVHLFFFFFLYLFFPYFHVSILLAYSQISKEHDQTCINLTNVFDIIGRFSSYDAFVGSNNYMPLLNKLHKNL